MGPGGCGVLMEAPWQGVRELLGQVFGARTPWQPVYWAEPLGGLSLLLPVQAGGGGRAEAEGEANKRPEETDKEQGI